MDNRNAMDPLSISASIITIIGTAMKVSHGLHSLYALRYAPQDILQLINEVIMIRRL